MRRWTQIGGLEMLMPVVHPAETWKATGRYYTIGPELARFKDRRGRDLVLAMTHEEVVAELCKSEVNSYRDLPRLVYHIQTKFRDDPRPRAGLIRVREFTMKDAYSLDNGRRGPRRAVPRPVSGLLQYLQPLRTARDRGRLGRRHDGRKPRTRVHVPDPDRRGHPYSLRQLRILGEPADRVLRQTETARGRAAAARTCHHAGHRDN